jgi:hypothetical protein
MSYTSIGVVRCRCPQGRAVSPSSALRTPLLEHFECNTCHQTDTYRIKHRNNWKHILRMYLGHHCPTPMTHIPGRKWIKLMYFSGSFLCLITKNAFATMAPHKTKARMMPHAYMLLDILDSAIAGSCMPSPGPVRGSGHPRLAPFSYRSALHHRRPSARVHPPLARNPCQRRRRSIRHSSSTP